MKECFIPKRFTAEYAAVIDQINSILAEYQAQGFVLTLRQLFYQFVSRGLRPNTIKTYTYLGAVLREARLAGEVDWDAIEDRTRETRRWSTWDDPADIIRASAEDYAEDLWLDQLHRPFVWIEKAALVNVIEAACREWQASYFAVRGYNSISEMYATGTEFGQLIREASSPIVLYLGDHDPSGINMTDVAREQLAMFADSDIEVRRVALNIDQVRQYRLPPNYAKVTDRRYAAYVTEFGTDCWELDALEPTVIDQILRREIEALVNMKKWRAAKKKQAANARILEAVADDWDAIADRYTE